MINIISTDDLKAVALAMAKADIRYYLNGVLFELDNAEGYRLVATDGHRMHIVCKKKSIGMSQEIIMPSDTVKQLCKLKEAFFTVELLESRQIKITTKSGVLIVQAVDGKYPDYRRVMPTKLQQTETAHYMSDYLVDLAKAQKILGTAQQKGYIAQQGNSAGVYVDNGKSFYAVIMPLRCDAPESSDFERGLAKVQS